jgi:hypothetical protein
VIALGFAVAEGPGGTLDMACPLQDVAAVPARTPQELHRHDPSCLVEQCLQCDQ